MADSITNQDSSFELRPDLPLGVEVRHLAALEAIAATKSFSQAAALLGYAQSAVSQQIATLERSVGHKLVERPGGPRPVSLTAAGEVLLRHAAHITARLSAAKADLDALAAGEIGSLRIGTFQSASARLLPPTLSSFRDHWPNVTVEVRNANAAATLEELVRSGHIDLAFTDVNEHQAPLESTELIHDPYVVMMPPNHPLASKETIDLTDLRGERMITGTSEDRCHVRTSAALAKAGVEPHVVFRTDDNLTIQRLVAAGLALAIAPLLAVELFVPDAEVIVIPIAKHQQISRTISIVWHQDRYRSRAATAFAETAIAVAQNIGLPSAPVVTSHPTPLLV